MISLPGSAQNAGVIQLIAAGKLDVNDVVAGANLHTWFRASTFDPTGGAFGFGRLPDLSGNNRHSECDAANATPTKLSSADFGNRQVLRLNGATNWMESVSPSSDYKVFHDGTYCVSIVVHKEALATFRSVFSTSQSGLTTPGFNARTHPTSGDYFEMHGLNGGTPSLLSIYTGVTNSTIPRISRFDHWWTASPTGKPFVDTQFESGRTLRYSNATGIDSPYTGSNPDYSLMMFRNNYTSGYWAGDFAELVMLVNPTQAEVDAVCWILAIRYGLRGGLGLSLPGEVLAAYDANKGVDLNGVNISAWTDQSLWLNEATQAVVADQPSYLSFDGEFRGNATVEANDSSDQLDFPLPFDADISTHYFVVRTPSSFPQGSRFVLRGNGGRQDTYLNGTNERFDIYGGANLASTKTLDPDKITIIRSVFNGASSSIYVEQEGSPGVLTTGNAGTQILTNCSLLSFGGTSQEYPDKLAFCMVCNGDTSADDSQFLKDLRKKYFLSAYATLRGELEVAGGDSLIGLYTADETTTNGSGRFRWTDVSGNGGHLDSPSASTDPVFHTDANGLQWIEFDGIDDQLDSVLAASNYTALHDGSRASIIALVDPLDTGGILGTAKNDFDTGVLLSALLATRWQGFLGNGSGSGFRANTGHTSAIEKTVARLDTGPTSVDVFCVDGDELKTATDATSSLDTGAPTYTLTVGKVPNGSFSKMRIRALALLADPTDKQVADVTAVMRQEASFGSFADWDHQVVNAESANITLDGSSNVEQWDGIGPGRSFIQTTPADRPNYSASDADFKTMGAVGFTDAHFMFDDGPAPDWSFLHDGSTDWEIVIVLNMDAAMSSGRHFISTANAVASAGIRVLLVGGSTLVAVISSGGTSILSTANSNLVAGTTQLARVRFEAATGTLEVRIDSATPTSSATASGYSAAIADGPLHINSTVGGGEKGNFKLGFLAIQKRLSSVNEISKQNIYLNGRYGTNGAT